MFVAGSVGFVALGARDRTWISQRHMAARVAPEPMNPDGCTQLVPSCELEKEENLAFEEDEFSVPDQQMQMLVPYTGRCAHPGTDDLSMPDQQMC